MPDGEAAASLEPRGDSEVAAVASGPRGRPVAEAWVAIGLFLVVTAVYALSGPGRIDIIDGQFRHEVTVNWLRTGYPQILDPILRAHGVEGLGGRLYSGYNAAASVAAMPLVWLGGLAEDPTGERRRFFFSLTSAACGGLLAAVLFAFYRLLGISRRGALGWTAVAVFGTHLWWLGTSTFDQAQHALFVLLAVYCGYLAGRRRSLILAVAGGLAAGVLINYQETFLLLAPSLGLAVFAAAESAEPESRARRGLRYLVFLAAVGVGLGLWFEYNQMRFGEPFVFNRFGLGVNHPPLFGDPLAGAASLLASPGKSVFLFSPPLVLGLLGLGGLRAQSHWLARAVIATGVVQFLFVSCLSFFGSDWAWGPRYIGVVLPLFALAFPFALRWSGACGRRLKRSLVAAGVVVQLLGLSLDHQRFFFEQALDDFFWVDSWVYFDHSQFVARPVELVQVVREGVPKEARQFQPTLYRRSVTYCMFGALERGPEWIRRFEVFWLPRPWPLWMAALPPERRPVPLLPSLGVTIAMVVAGGAAIRYGLGSVPPAVA